MQVNWNVPCEFQIPHDVCRVKSEIHMEKLVDLLVFIHTGSIRLSCYDDNVPVSLPTGQVCHVCPSGFFHV